MDDSEFQPFPDYETPQPQYSDIDITTEPMLDHEQLPPQFFIPNENGGFGFDLEPEILPDGQIEYQGLQTSPEIIDHTPPPSYTIEHQYHPRHEQQPYQDKYYPNDQQHRQPMNQPRERRQRPPKRGYRDEHVAMYDAETRRQQSTDQMQFLMMNQLMNQQMTAQQMQVAQMAALAQNQQSHNRGGGCGGGRRGGGVSSIQVQNCQNGGGKIRRRPIRRKITRPIAVVPPVVQAAPAQALPVVVDDTAFDNWQEITVILVIAIVGLIYLVCSRSSGTEEKKQPSQAARHLT